MARARGPFAFQASHQRLPDLHLLEAIGEDVLAWCRQRDQVDAIDIFGTDVAKIAGERIAATEDHSEFAFRQALNTAAACHVSVDHTLIDDKNRTSETCTCGVQGAVAIEYRCVEDHRASAHKNGPAQGSARTTRLPGGELRTEARLARDWSHRTRRGEAMPTTAGSKTAATAVSAVCSARRATCATATAEATATASSRDGRSSSGITRGTATAAAAGKAAGATVLPTQASGKRCTATAATAETAATRRMTEATPGAADPAVRRAGGTARYRSSGRLRAPAATTRPETQCGDRIRRGEPAGAMHAATTARLRGTTT